MSHWIVNLLVPVPVRYILYLKPFVSISTFFLHVWRSWIRIQNGSGSTSLQGMPRYKWILGARHYVTWPPNSCQGQNSSLISSYNLGKLIVAKLLTGFKHPSPIWSSIVLSPQNKNYSAKGKNNTHPKYVIFYCIRSFISLNWSIITLQHHCNTHVFFYCFVLYVSPSLKKRNNKRSENWMYTIRLGGTLGSVSTIHYRVSSKSNFGLSIMWLCYSVGDSVLSHRGFRS